MSISARNKIQGQISAIHAGEGMSLVTVQAGENHLGAAITRAAGSHQATEVMLLK